jgi:hypothetical protein
MDRCLAALGEDTPSLARMQVAVFRRVRVLECHSYQDPFHGTYQLP